MDPCIHCGIAKARQNNLVKFTDIKSQIKGARLFIDLKVGQMTQLMVEQSIGCW